MQLWQPQSCSKIVETEEINDFQQISQYGSLSKIPHINYYDRLQIYEV